MIGVVFFQNKRLDRDTIQNIKIFIKSILYSKNDYIKDTRIRRKYPGRKQRATGYVYLKVSSYCDAEGSSQLRSCLHDAIIHASPIIGRKIDKLELYRQCTHRRLKDTHMT